MANPILRAGPYASPTNSFISDSTIYQRFGQLELPVNCNTRDWVNDTWKALLVFTHDSIDPTILVSEEHVRGLDGTISFELGTIDRSGDHEGIYFGYQAANDFTLTGTFSASPSFGGGIEDFGFVIGDQIFVTRYFVATTLSGTFSVTLPKAIVPKFVNLSLSGQAGAIDGAQIVINNLQPRL